MPQDPQSHAPEHKPEHAPEHEPEIAAIRLAPLTLTDLLGDLRWPRLCRASTLALRPANIGLALVALLLIGLIARPRPCLRAGRAWQPAHRTPLLPP